MKRTIYLLICLILLLGCLKAKRSPFDFSSPKGLNNLFGIAVLVPNALTGGNSNATSSSSNTTVPPPTIKNLFSNRVFNSSFIIGTATTGTTVEISLDSGATYQTVTGTTNWSYKLPTTFAWKEGAKRIILVRSKSNGLTSISVSINAIKGQNKDVNGDGYPDLLIGADTASASFGKAYLFYGGANSISTGNDSTANTIITSTSASTLGHSVSISDINGDGYGDIIIAAQTATGSNGKVYIFYGSSSGIASANDTAANVTITGTLALGLFGSSVYSGDINGDGFSDVAIGAPGVSTNLGKAYIFYGSASGITSANDTAANVIITGTLASGKLGFSVSLGDINGDGYSDLLIGANGVTANLGKAYIFYGSTSGIASANDTAANVIITGTAAGGQLGNSVSAGDVNGDGYADLFVGAFIVSANLGKAYIYYGSASGITNANDTAANVTITGTVANLNLGYSVSCGDVNGDGYTDFMVGAYSLNGNGYIFYGSASGITNTNDTAANVIITGTVANGALGNYVTSMDINADGYSDFIIAADLGNAMGKVYIFRGNSTGISSSNDTGANTTLSGTNANGQFGAGMN